MGTRRRAREFALQALYQADLAETSAVEALNGLWTGQMDGEGLDEEQKPAEGEEVAFAERLVSGVVDHADELDALIEDASTNWRLPRMPIVDRNILRLATFELKHCDDIPPNVSINEAIELAKRFGTADSKAFVNGIVDRVGRSLGRIDGKRRRR